MSNKETLQLKWAANNKVAGAKGASVKQPVELFSNSIIDARTEWYFTNGVFISKLDSNLVLDVCGGYARENVPVILYPMTGNRNQRWRFEDGYIYSDLDNSFVLAVKDKSLVIQKKVGLSQKWLWSDPSQPDSASSCCKKLDKILEVLASKIA